MDSSSLTLRLGSPFLQLNAQSSLTPSYLHFPISKPFKNTPFKLNFRVKASNNSSKNPIIHKLKTTAGAIVFIATAFSVLGKFQNFPARAETLQTPTEEIKEEEINEQEKPGDDFLESDSIAVDSLKSQFREKIKAGENEESLRILKKLDGAQPENTEWKFLMARLLNEMGEAQEARKVYEEILARNPLSFEALFENAMSMDQCGDGEVVIKRLEEALTIAVNEKKEKEARDVRLIMAQIQFLQKNVEEALKSYEELGREDPDDFRPYFCKGMIYSLLDKNEEASEQFAKYRELSPKKFEVEGYLRTPMSRMKLFGADNEEN
ncbi:hypothetical protein LguiA_031447 [Lonicera macranthoides]